MVGRIQIGHKLERKYGDRSDQRRSDLLTCGLEPIECFSRARSAVCDQVCSKEPTAIETRSSRKWHEEWKMRCTVLDYLTKGIVLILEIGRDLVRKQKAYLQAIGPSSVAFARFEITTRLRSTELNFPSNTMCCLHLE
jgi:hypothetical protein